ncbi:MAG TPA: hypothetical protein VMM78_01450 [Thermomicrobiales bacterium]|nr:hypothetical protein [Thermomicrobiales bacterium]
MSRERGPCAYATRRGSHADCRNRDHRAAATEAGVRMNVNVALQYLNAWLGGTGAAAIHNLMEDVATAEISRAQLWQWIRHCATLDTGGTVTADTYTGIRAEELTALGGPSADHYGAAANILDALILDEGFAEFLTLAAYERPGAKS